MLARYERLPEHLKERAQHSALNYVCDHYQLAQLMDDPLVTESQAAQLMDRQYMPLVHEVLKSKYFDQHGMLCLDVMRIKAHEEQQRAAARAQRVAKTLERAIEKHPKATGTKVVRAATTSAPRAL